jgi:tetratricopeptide (TPR) repeat protein
MKTQFWRVVLILLISFGASNSFAHPTEAPSVRFRFQLLPAETLWTQYHETSWYFLGVAYLQNERYIEALNAFDYALQYDPDFHEAYQNMGYAFFRLGDFQQSALAMAMAIKLNPDNEYAHHLLGVIFTLYSMYESAVLELEKAASINPKNALIYYDLGFAHEFGGSLSMAKKSYESALKLEPSFKEAQDRLKGVEEKLNIHSVQP